MQAQSAQSTTWHRLMLLEFAMTLLFGVLAVIWGMRWGRLLLRKGATANNFFTGRNLESLAFLGVYIGLLLLALHLPQWPLLPLDWRVSGMRITWTMMRVLLLGFCGAAFVVSAQTARRQIMAVVLLGLLGLGAFTAAEVHFLAPIYASLENNLRPNGVFRQTADSSCAPAAMATVLRRWGLNATESSVAQFAGTSRLGTSMPQLIVAARAFGLDGIELSPTWEQMHQINRPGILATWLFSKTGKAPHAVGLLSMTAETITIADPAFGKLYELDQTRFDRIWRKEYLPIFRPEEVTLDPAKAARHLSRLGYLNQPTGIVAETLTQAVQRFQVAMGLAATGELDTETVLLLTGPFLQQEPTLTDFVDRSTNDTTGDSEDNAIQMKDR
jgi:predicted double-glycine peptidase